MSKMLAMAKSSRTSKPSARDFAIEAARLTAATRCSNVVLLDVRGVSPITDYLILATGTSGRQMRSVCDELSEWAQERGVRTFSSDGLESEHWMVIDFVDTVVHVFDEASRSFYDLDSLWGDAKPIEWQDKHA